MNFLIGAIIGAGIIIGVLRFALRAPPAKYRTSDVSDGDDYTAMNGECPSSGDQGAGPDGAE